MVMCPPTLAMLLLWTGQWWTDVKSSSQNVFSFEPFDVTHDAYESLVSLSAIAWWGWDSLNSYALYIT